MVFRKIGLATKLTVFLVKNGDEYEFHGVATFKTSILKFKLGEEFEEETPDGRKVLTTFTLDGNTLTQIQKTDKPSTIVRIFSETDLVATLTYGGVKCTRWYKVVS